MRIYFKRTGSLKPEVIEVEALPNVGDTILEHYKVLHIRPPQSTGTWEPIPIVTAQSLTPVPKRKPSGRPKRRGYRTSK